MRQLYSLLLWLALPLILTRLLWRSRRQVAYRQRLGERLSWTPAPRADLWCHAVSVGEVQAAAPLLAHLLAVNPDLRILVTTTTPTGAARVLALFGEQVLHRYLPFDLPQLMQRFVAQVQPQRVLVLETEIWPNLLAVCAEREVPVLLINARLSARSARGYARLGSFTSATLAQFHLIAAQTAADAERFIALGADPARVAVMGNLKFDQCVPADLPAQAATLRAMWGGAERPVWVAASTHEGEETVIVAAHQLLRAQVPTALLVLVPRHPERFERVATLVAQQNMPLVRRSTREEVATTTAVLLGDSMGEVPLFLAASDVAFIGGSLVAVGGHNPLEAAAVAVPVLVGPHTFNFAAMTADLLALGAARRVTDAATLAATLAEWLTDTGLRTAAGTAGLALVAQQRGAVLRVVALMDDFGIRF
ncbi:3-deoxy-D-manno-octulosonic acid transferase [Chromatium okenii]|uniref:lipid IV(A) 3-deoxy-D-manno-octulosonic acid transferase n=1 Tax=Chromatium okenii TaxID=61644 RepID=UPI00190467C2|nr:lipid IV(A) 3-deoxy-D-manno-octulosonic acid transferase [Chromatium okenii]MBK1641481.1 3-deoxy-D-manno-octulosonic acid transferase [Chromatium okenii]